MSAAVDLAKFTAASSGTGDFVVSAAATGYQTPAQASAVNGALYTYRAESADLSQWEMGEGVYTSSGTTLARTTILFSSTGSKVSFTAAPTVGLVFRASSIREKLAADRTYYVRTDGSDSNSGLANTSGGAFLTLQKAINTVAALDLAIYNVTINVAAGTYTAGILVIAPFFGAGTVTVTGDTTTPANVIISTTSANCVDVRNSAVLYVGGFKFTTTTSGHAVIASLSGKVFVNGKCDFSTLAAGYAHLGAASGGFVQATANYNITGNANAHLSASGGGVVQTTGVTVDGGGAAIAFSKFAAAATLGTILGASVTYSNVASFTGSRYTASNNGLIDSGGGGTSYFPGNSAGTGTNAGASPYGLYV